MSANKSNTSMTSSLLKIKRQISIFSVKTLITTINKPINFKKKDKLVRFFLVLFWFSFDISFFFNSTINREKKPARTHKYVKHRENVKLKTINKIKITNQRAYLAKLYMYIHSKVVGIFCVSFNNFGFSFCHT